MHSSTAECAFLAVLRYNSNRSCFSKEKILHFIFCVKVKFNSGFYIPFNRHIWTDPQYCHLSELNQHRSDTLRLEAQHPNHYVLVDHKKYRTKIPFSIVY